ncbi:hypothetical protein [Paraburkholderia nodosa]|uniref:hypothetical protein n=1 Tax=Paraburkholderia nodosa TaxID=392320 RepID=UPI0012B68B8E|nr:hypothetical protein [Paraburkholderia nodosa]
MRAPLRIIDRDNVNDCTLDAGDTQPHETLPDRAIELFDFGGAQRGQSGTTETV